MAMMKRQEIRNRRRTDMTRLTLFFYYVGCCQERNNLGLIDPKLHLWERLKGQNFKSDDKMSEIQSNKIEGWKLFT